MLIQITWRICHSDYSARFRAQSDLLRTPLLGIPSVGAWCIPTLGELRSAPVRLCQDPEEATCPQRGIYVEVSSGISAEGL